MTKPDPAIVARKLSRRFADLIAVDALNLTVKPGEIFGLVGPDGAGKTTTLRMLSSIMSPTSGTASIAGWDVATSPDRVKDNIAYMSQHFGLYVDLTVQENINFYADLYGVSRKGRTDRINELLNFSNMRRFKGRRAGNLSGGMKQKLQLVCSLIHTPRVLLLDEPTNGVDPVSRRDFWRILYRLVRQEVAILVTTAYLDEAERCNRVGLLDRGRILAQGTPDEVKQLLPGTILTVRTSEGRRAARLLRSSPGCKSANLFGDTVHVLTGDPDQARSTIYRVLHEAAVTIDDIRQQAASIEDVFVSELQDETGSARLGGGEIHSREQSDTSAPVRARPDAVNVDNLTRRFGTFTAVNRVSFSVPRGQIFGFLGPNGAGKSTCIRMLCGLLAPSGGTGSVAGFDITRQAEQIKKNIGYMSQKFSLYDDLTVEENIDFYGGIYGLGAEELTLRKSWAVEMAGLNQHRSSLTAILSGGWKQRLAMACAVLHRPPIVFLDEPTSGADPLSRRRFWDLIYSMAEQGVTIFVTTHYMEEAEYCERLALIYNGRIIAMGTPRDLKTGVMKDTILDIRCPRPQDIMDRLAGLPEVREIALFGAGLHAVVDHTKRAETAIRNECTNAGHRLEGLEQVIPDMEDVFVSLIEAEERNEKDARSYIADV